MKDPQGHSYLRDMFYQYEAPLANCDRGCPSSDLESILPNRNEYRVGITTAEFVRMRLRYMERVGSLAPKDAKNIRLGPCLSTFRNVEQEFKKHIETRKVTLYGLFLNSEVQKEFSKKCSQFLKSNPCAVESDNSASRQLQEFRGFSCVWRQVIHGGKPLNACNTKKQDRRGPASVREIVEQGELPTSSCAAYIHRLDKSIEGKSLAEGTPQAATSHSLRSENDGGETTPSRALSPLRQPARQAPQLLPSRYVQQ